MTRNEMIGKVESLLLNAENAGPGYKLTEHYETLAMLWTQLIQVSKLPVTQEFANAPAES